MISRELEMGQGKQHIGCFHQAQRLYFPGQVKLGRSVCVNADGIPSMSN